MPTVRQNEKTASPNPRIGVDTYSVRLYFRGASSSITNPTLPGFRVDWESEYCGYSGQALSKWHRTHPDLQVRVYAHELETWTPPDEDVPRVSGKVDITFEISRLAFAHQHPDAPVFLNTEACSSDEAGSIYLSVLRELTAALEIGEYSDEVLTVHPFGDFVCDNKRAALDGFSRRPPKVYKASEQISTIYQPGAGTVEHPRYKGNGKGGREETILYSRAQKISKDLEAAGLSGHIEPGSDLDMTLRLEARHGKERKGGCRPLIILDDYSARPLRASDDEADEHGPTMSVEESLDPRIWAGIILQRLKECGLYGQDSTPIEVSPSRHDLRRLLLAAGISRGTAHQYADLVFDGEQVLREEGCDTAKLRKKVESVLGRTFVTEDDRHAVDLFSPIIEQALTLARASEGVDPSRWTYRPVFPELAPLLQEPLPPGHGPNPLDPQDILRLCLDLDNVDALACQGQSVPEVDSPGVTNDTDQAHDRGGGQGPVSVILPATWTHDVLSPPAPAEADSGHFSPASGKSAQRSLPFNCAPQNRDPPLEAILETMCEPPAQSTHPLAEQLAAQGTPPTPLEAWILERPPPPTIDPLLAQFLEETAS